ncbi:dirigent protein 1-like [Miscanthus floridulus]|uniref:dirigent protein 1-like n=1 Tax=Miscanthus floridulus TaxID=154761 RepID=UPI00345A8D6F
MAASTIPTVLLASAILVAAATYFLHDTRSSNGLTAGTHLHFYMHDQYTGENPTAALIVPGRPSLSNSSATTTVSSDGDPAPRRFGDVAVMNNALTEGPERGSPRVGTAQGFTVRVADRGSVNALSMHLVMEAGEHAGSSLVVSGRVDTDLAVRESVIVGGTGRFRGARGYALSRSFDYDLAKGGVVEIDVYLY